MIKVSGFLYQDYYDLAFEDDHRVGVRDTNIAIIIIVVNSSLQLESNKKKCSLVEKRACLNIIWLGSTIQAKSVYTISFDFILFFLFQGALICEWDHRVTSHMFFFIYILIFFSF